MMDESRVTYGFTHLEFVYGADDSVERPGTMLLAANVVLSTRVDNELGEFDILGVEAPV